MNISAILTALEGAVVAYNPAIGATVVALTNLTQSLVSAYKNSTGKDLTDITQAEWDAMTSAWRTERDALEQSFKDHPGV